MPVHKKFTYWLQLTDFAMPQFLAIWKTVKRIRVTSKWEVEGAVIPPLSLNTPPSPLTSNILHWLFVGILWKILEKWCWVFDASICTPCYCHLVSHSSHLFMNETCSTYPSDIWIKCRELSKCFKVWKRKCIIVGVGWEIFPCIPFQAYFFKENKTQLNGS